MYGEARQLLSFEVYNSTVDKVLHVGRGGGRGAAGRGLADNTSERDRVVWKLQDRQKVSWKDCHVSKNIYRVL